MTMFLFFAVVGAIAFKWLDEKYPADGPYPFSDWGTRDQKPPFRNPGPKTEEYEGF